MRQRLKFEDFEAGGTVFLRMVADEPNFVLIHSTSKQTLKVERLWLHIDFMHAEIYPNDLGATGRGLGVVEFGGGGPRIIDRNPNHMDTSGYGFVFDMASPYPIRGLSGLKPHPVGSTLTPVRRSIAQAYELYLEAVQEEAQLGGVMMPGDPGYKVPVFDVAEWKRGQNGKSVFGGQGSATYQPVFKLLGFVDHIATPLTSHGILGRQPRQLAEPVLATDPAYGGLPDETGGIAGTAGDPIPPRRFKSRPKLDLGNNT